MPSTTQRTDPELWERIKAKVTRGSKGGRPGQWSARKAQLAVQDYKKAGGGYRGARSSRNHLVQWTEEDWGTRSGRRSRDTGERYLPRRARRALTDKEYDRTSRKKRTDTAKGRQLSKQPRSIARKTARFRSHEEPATRADLYAMARERNIPGRSKMNKADLQKALKRSYRS